MNERIEALEKLATKEVWCNNPYNGSPEFAGYELDANMFAELIIKECIGVMVKNDYHGEWLGEKVKEHFEVK